MSTRNEPLLSDRLHDESHESYPQLKAAKAASDERKRFLIADEIAWHEKEIERLKAMADEPPIQAPF